MVTSVVISVPFIVVIHLPSCFVFLVNLAYQIIHVLPDFKQTVVLAVRLHSLVVLVLERLIVVLRQVGVFQNLLNRDSLVGNKHENFAKQI